jgi:hypothetical protein
MNALKISFIFVCGNGKLFFWWWPSPPLQQKTISFSKFEVIFEVIFYAPPTGAIE